MNRRDQREATSLFGLFEREIVPLFYDRGPDGIPIQWIEKMKDNWRSLGPFVTAARMARDYTSQLYEPAAASAATLFGDNASRGKALAHWKQRILQHWAAVKVVDVDVDTAAASEGEARTVRARVELGGLDAAEVLVQALHGPIDSQGSFISSPATFTLQPTGDGSFEGGYLVGEAGPYGVTVRAIPHHVDLINPMELGVVAWAT